MTAPRDSFRVTLPPWPYPGLRPFETHEWPIFFGRESMADEVVSRLIERQVVVVHGDSGCGKSSLIRAGVQPRLEQEHARGGVRWQTSRAQPREAPLRRLAASLAPLDGDGAADEDHVTELRRLLNHGLTASVAVAERLRLGGANNLCVLIDQFEELFDFARTHGPDEARLLTQFVVGALRDKPPGLHVIITMRSEFLGACAQYRGFAEAVNDTQYLLPRMSHESMVRAIREPATLYGGHVTLELAERLVADGGGGQDELPLIQHGLMMLHRRVTDEPAQPGAAGGRRPDGWRLDLSAYEGTGGLRSLLSRNADEACAAAGGPDSPVIQHLFRALIDINAEGLAIRRPQSFDALVEVTGADPATLTDVIGHFRADRVSFLQPHGDKPLTPDTRIDISHEALIRCWDRIADKKVGWLAREFQDGLIWRSLIVQADSFERDRSSVLSHATAIERQAWMTGTSNDATQPGHNAAWARRYSDRDDDWSRVATMVTASLEAALERERIERRNRRNNALTRAGGAALVVALLALGVYAIALIGGNSAAEAKDLWGRLDFRPYQATDQDQRIAAWALSAARPSVRDAFIAQASGNTSDLVGLASNPEAFLRALYVRWPAGRAESLLNTVITRAEESQALAATELEPLLDGLAERIAPSNRGNVFATLVTPLPVTATRRDELRKAAARSIGTRLDPGQAAVALSARPSLPPDETGAYAFGVIFEPVASRVRPDRVADLMSPLIGLLAGANSAQSAGLSRIILAFRGSPRLDDVLQALNASDLLGSSPVTASRRDVLQAILGRLPEEQAPAVASALLARLPQAADTAGTLAFTALWTALPGAAPVPQVGGVLDAMLLDPPVSSDARRGLLLALAGRLSEEDAIQLVRLLSASLAATRDAALVDRLMPVLRAAAERVRGEGVPTALAALTAPLPTATPATVWALGTAIGTLPKGQSELALPAIERLLDRRRVSAAGDHGDLDTVVATLAGRVRAADAVATVDRIVDVALRARRDSNTDALLRGLQAVPLADASEIDETFARLFADLERNASYPRRRLVVEILRALPPTARVDPSSGRLGLEAIVREVVRPFSDDRRYPLLDAFREVSLRLRTEQRSVAVAVCARALGQTLSPEGRTELVNLLSVLASVFDSAPGAGVKPPGEDTVSATIELLITQIAASRDVGSTVDSLGTALNGLIAVAGQEELPRIIDRLRTAVKAHGESAKRWHFEGGLRMAFSHLSPTQAQEQVNTALNQLRASTDDESRQAAEQLIDLVFNRLTPEQAAATMAEALRDFGENHKSKLGSLAGALRSISYSSNAQALDFVRALAEAVAIHLASPADPAGDEVSRARQDAAGRLVAALQAILATVGGASGELSDVVTALQQRESPADDAMLVSAARAVEKKFNRSQADLIVTELKGVLGWHPDASAAQEAALLFVALVSSWPEQDRYAATAEVLTYPLLGPDLTRGLLDALYEWTGKQSPGAPEGLQANLEWLAARSSALKAMLDGEPPCPAARARELRCP